MKYLSKDHKKILENLGLTKNQSLLYITSLQKGLLSALELSRITKINRQQVYKDAEALVEKGLYEPTSRNRKKYIPAHPSTLLKIQQEKVTQQQAVFSSLNELVPHLESLAQNYSPQVISHYYEGVERIQKGYAKELASAKNTEVLSFVGSIENTFSFFPKPYWDTWNKEIAKQHTSGRMLVHDSENAKDIQMWSNTFPIQARFLKNFPLKANIDMWDNSLYMISFDEEVGAWMESKFLAETFKIIFESLWGIAHTPE